VGEIVRAYLVATHEGFGRSAALATVIVERMVDLFSVLLIFAYVMLSDYPRGDAQFESVLRGSAAGFMVIGGLLLGALWVLRRHRALLTRKIQAFGDRHLHGLARQAWRVEAFADGIVLTGSYGRIFLFISFTIIIWIGTVGQIKILADSFNLGISWATSCILLVSLAIGVSLPSAPGLIGTYHYAAIVVLLGYNIPRAQGVAYAVVLHAGNVLPVLALGLYFLWTQGLSVRALIHLKDSAVGKSR
jgi:uncharacterized membrane protein YbhN (UPF0104 family)